MSPSAGWWEVQSGQTSDFPIPDSPEVLAANKLSSKKKADLQDVGWCCAGSSYIAQKFKEFKMLSNFFFCIFKRIMQYSLIFLFFTS